MKKNEDAQTVEQNQNGTADNNNNELKDILGSEKTRHEEQIPFHDFEKEPKLIGVYMGHGKVLNEGQLTETKTHKFMKVYGGKLTHPVMVPQWKGLEKLNNCTELLVTVYEVEHLELAQLEDGREFHKVQLTEFAKKLSSPVQY